MSEITEIHEPFIRYLKDKGIEFTRARSDKASTIEKGACDFVLHHPAYPSIFMEMKGDKTPVTTAQKRVHARLTGRGHIVHVVRSVKEAVQITEAWLDGLTFRKPASANVEPAREQLRQHHGWVWANRHGGWEKIRRATAEDLNLPRLL